MRVKLAAALAVGAMVWTVDGAPLGRGAVPAVPVARADGWRAEFDDVCSRTQDAMTLSAAELRQLVVRCDKLKPAIDALEESMRKVYSRRLEACRALYQFMLDSKGEGAAG